MRVLIDTNVFVAALLRSVSCRAILEAFRDGRFTLITSEALLAELTDVLGRPKFSGGVSPDDCRDVLKLIRREGTFVAPKESSVAVRDVKDRPVVNCLYAADVLVTGDHDLHVLGRVEKTEILFPSQFLSRLGKRRHPT